MPFTADKLNQQIRASTIQEARSIILSYWKEESPVSKRALHVRKSMLDVLARELPQVISNITTKTIKDFVDSCLEKGRTADTARKYVGTLRRVFKYARYPLHDNPAHMVISDGYKCKMTKVFQNGRSRRPGETRASPKRPKAFVLPPEPITAPLPSVGDLDLIKPTPQVSAPAPQVKFIATAVNSGYEPIELRSPSLCDLWLNLGIRLMKMTEHDSEAVAIMIKRVKT